MGSLRRNCPDQVVEVAVGGSPTPLRPLSPAVDIGSEQRRSAGSCALDGDAVSDSGLPLMLLSVRARPQVALRGEC